MNKQGVLKFLKANELCVLATSDFASKPEAAVISYVINDDFEILIFTENGTRKYPNLTENNQVALVIGGLKNDPTVQMDARIQEFGKDDSAEAERYTLNLHPEWKDYFSTPKGRWFKVIPFWLRYSDFSQNPQDIFETDF